MNRGIPIFIEHLLAIESDAQDAMNDIAKENLIISHKAKKDLASRIASIENEGAEAIRRIVRETDNHTAARIEEIKEEYRAKSEMFEKDFEANKKIMRGRIFHDVLHGKP